MYQVVAIVSQEVAGVLQDRCYNSPGGTRGLQDVCSGLPGGC